MGDAVHQAGTSNWGMNFGASPPPTPPGEAWRSLNASGSVTALKFRSRQGSRARRRRQSPLTDLLSPPLPQTCLRVVFLRGRSSSRGVDEGRQDGQTDGQRRFFRLAGEIQRQRLPLGQNWLPPPGCVFLGELQYLR